MGVSLDYYKMDCDSIFAQNMETFQSSCVGVPRIKKETITRFYKEMKRGYQGKDHAKVLLFLADKVI